MQAGPLKTPATSELSPISATSSGTEQDARQKRPDNWRPQYRAYTRFTRVRQWVPLPTSLAQTTMTKSASGHICQKWLLWPRSRCRRRGTNPDPPPSCCRRSAPSNDTMQPLAVPPRASIYRAAHRCDLTFPKLRLRGAPSSAERGRLRLALFQNVQRSDERYAPAVFHAAGRSGDQKRSLLPAR